MFWKTNEEEEYKRWFFYLIMNEILSGKRERGGEGCKDLFYAFVFDCVFMHKGIL